MAAAIPLSLRRGCIEEKNSIPAKAPPNAHLPASPDAQALATHPSPSPTPTVATQPIQAAFGLSQATPTMNVDPPLPAPAVVAEGQELPGGPPPSQEMPAQHHAQSILGSPEPPAAPLTGSVESAALLPGVRDTCPPRRQMAGPDLTQVHALPVPVDPLPQHTSNEQIPSLPALGANAIEPASEALRRETRAYLALLLGGGQEIADETRELLWTSCARHRLIQADPRWHASGQTEGEPVRQAALSPRERTPVDAVDLAPPSIQTGTCLRTRAAHARRRSPARARTECTA